MLGRRPSASVLAPLVPNSSQLQPSSLTVPLIVNPDIQKAYNE